MIERNTTVPFRFVCLTDYFFDADGVSCYPLVYGWHGWWSKIELFRRGIATGRSVFFDLDTIICENIDPILNARTQFAFMRGIGRVADERSTAIMAWEPSDYLASIYDTFVSKSDEFIKRYRSDQDYMNDFYQHPTGWIQDYYSSICSYEYHWKRHGQRTGIVIFHHGHGRPWTASAEDQSLAGLYQ